MRESGSLPAEPRAKGGAWFSHRPNRRAPILVNRHGRIEPRAIKRKPKEHALLTKPRDEARAGLLEGKSM